jgi:hypothetical protein
MTSSTKTAHFHFFRSSHAASSFVLTLLLPSFYSYSLSHSFIMSPRPSRAAAAAAEKKIKRDIEEILLPSDVKENYHRADFAVRMATKNGKDMPSSSHRNTATTTTTTTATGTTLTNADDMTQQQQPRNHKKAKTSTSTTVPTKFDKTPPPPPRHSSKTVVMDIDDIADAVENGPIMGRSTALYVNKTMEYAVSPLYPQAIHFAKRVRRHG